MEEKTFVETPTHEQGRKVLDLTSRMGEQLLLNGAEIARVQSTTVYQLIFF